MKNYISLEENEYENNKNINNEYCIFSDLTYKERLIYFFFLSCIGYLIEIGSLSRFIKSVSNPSKFVILYSIGNLINLFSISILIGLNNLINKMKDPVRKYTTIFFLTSIVLSIILSFYCNNFITKFWLIILVILQFLSYWWYALSYIPFAQRIAKKIFNKYILEE